ncbi:unnamed protein product [Sphagnum troendelagicum]
MLQLASLRHYAVGAAALLQQALRQRCGNAAATLQRCFSSRRGSVAALLQLAATMESSALYNDGKWL